VPDSSDNDESDDAHSQKSLMAAISAYQVNKSDYRASLSHRNSRTSVCTKRTSNASACTSWQDGRPSVQDPERVETDLGLAEGVWAPLSVNKLDEERGSLEHRLSTLSHRTSINSVCTNWRDEGLTGPSIQDSERVRRDLSLLSGGWAPLSVQNTERVKSDPNPEKPDPVCETHILSEDESCHTLTPLSPSSRWFEQELKTSTDRLHGGDRARSASIRRASERMTISCPWEAGARSLTPRRQRAEAPDEIVKEKEEKVKVGVKEEKEKAKEREAKEKEENKVHPHGVQLDKKSRAEIAAEAHIVRLKRARNGR